jgi:Pyruvate/2-oxoacid:ferredoxin oxidoreductase gamma subunit
MRGADMVQKWAVLPVSAIAGEEEGEDAEEAGDKGGPIARGASDEEAEKAVVRTDIGTNTFLAGASGATTGFPLGQEPGAAGPERGPARWLPRV